MALQECEECGNEIDSKSSACSHCGCPIKSEEPRTETGSLEGAHKNESTISIIIELLKRILLAIIISFKYTKKFIQKFRKFSAFISLFLGIVIGIMGYVPEYMRRLGSDASLSVYYLFPAIAFILFAFIIYTKKWPPEE